MLGKHHLALAAVLAPSESGLKYVARCSCGWASEPCATPVLADASAEQHVTLERTNRPRRGARHPSPS